MLQMQPKEIFTFPILCKWNVKSCLFEITFPDDFRKIFRSNQRRLIRFHVSSDVLYWTVKKDSKVKLDFRNSKPREDWKFIFPNSPTLLRPGREKKINEIFLREVDEKLARSENFSAFIKSLVLATQFIFSITGSFFLPEVWWCLKKSSSS